MTAATTSLLAVRDSRLARRAAAGDAAALEAIIRTHEGRVRAICRSVLRNTHDAEDAAQETWARAIRALARFDGEDLGAWLATIARNESYRAAAQRSRRAVPVEELPAVADADADPYAEVRRAEVSRALRAVVVSLPETYREVAVRDLSGQQPAEIAEVLSLTPGATRVRTHRARREIQRRLAEGALAA
jgi:RNA polymerase sigma-70 factor, ECF subfamily